MEYINQRRANEAMSQRIDQLEAENKRLNEVKDELLRVASLAETQFAKYEVSHSVKGTTEGDLKAKTNRAFKEMLNKALAKAKEQTK